MVALPGLNDYTDAEKEALKKWSPACSNYFNLIAQKPQLKEDEFRRNKHLSWLCCALATFHGRASAQDVCHFWSAKSEDLLRAAWTECGLNGSDLLLLAFGKLGSMELNLSSDIDLVFLRHTQATSHNPTPLLRKFLKFLTENRVWGFAYRVDLNLRPGGEGSPLAPDMSHFFNFFDEYLEAWHRLSFLRMRPLIGAAEALEDLKSYCHRLSFPKRLDFSLIEEIKSIRSRLNYQWHQANEPLNIKFHPGGIRDIELYIHALQVIYGGKRPLLQVRDFSAALENLQREGILPEDDYTFLHQFYWQLREIENIIQVRDDSHSYLFREKDTPAHSPFRERALLQKLKQAETLIASFFVEPPLRDTHKKTRLCTEGLNEKERAATQQILNLNSPVLLRDENERMKRDILNEFLSHTSRIAVDRELAIQIFRDFIISIKSKSSVFHLLTRHPKLIENLAWLFSVSPFMGQILCRRPELLDSFTLGTVSFTENMDISDLLENLHDYKLLGNLISVSHFLKHQNVTAFCLAQSERADFIVDKIMNFLAEQFGCSPLEVLCMGKWGGEELGIQSDLDLVLTCDESPTQKHIQMARRFINLMTAPGHTGRLYSIDLRLKPEETSGPLLVHKEKLLEYLKQSADPWQKQAYLRARKLGQKQAFFRKNNSLLKLSESEKKDLEKIHAKVLTQWQESAVDLKTAYGGIVHTEFTMQKYILYKGLDFEHPSTPRLIGDLDMSPGLKEQLCQNYLKLRQFEQIYQICEDSTRTLVRKESASMERLNRILKTTSAYNELLALLSEQRGILKKLDLNS